MADPTAAIRSELRAAARLLTKAAALIREARGALDISADNSTGFTRTHCELASKATSAALANIDEALGHAEQNAARKRG